MGIKIDIKIKKSVWLKGKIKKNNNSYKRAKKKNKNQNNKDEIGKHDTMNLDWKMKLKTNKIFTKRQRKKLKIKRIRTKLKIIIFGKLSLNDEIESK